ncbi:hypothetical protein HYFRA_00013042 [Hymenoscyphus fraxineus]|uniref:Uncharacterized protein n=1 Tax=Hymenoscyphus fraxineus TaxID=746836 RepID=A0A9N9PXW0_9HELO|nr:hypothetical protein HYFRA_00013042 [Hymenoscyphus fraxineus]
MLFKSSLLATAMIFAGQASAVFVFCPGSPNSPFLERACLVNTGSEVTCQNVEGNCRPNCFAGSSYGIRAVCCQKDDTINMFCFKK